MAPLAEAGHRSSQKSQARSSRNEVNNAMPPRPIGAPTPPPSAASTRRCIALLIFAAVLVANYYFALVSTADERTHSPLSALSAANTPPQPTKRLDVAQLAALAEAQRAPIVPHRGAAPEPAAWAQPAATTATPPAAATPSAAAQLERIKAAPRSGGYGTLDGLAPDYRAALARAETDDDVLSVAFDATSPMGEKTKPTYRVTKAMLNRWTRAVASAADVPFSCAAVCPGWCRTRMGGDDATRSAAQGAASILAPALEPDPTRFAGTLSRDGEVIEW